jgi:hypothetical protein
MAEKKTEKKVFGTVTLEDGTVVKMRKPKLRDIKAINGIEDPLMKESTLISNLSGITIDKLDDMDFDDYSLLSEEINTFLYSTGKIAEKG